jgi:hypothetical protein
MKENVKVGGYQNNTFLIFVAELLKFILLLKQQAEYMEYLSSLKRLSTE